MLGTRMSRASSVVFSVSIRISPCVVVMTNAPCDARPRNQTLSKIFVGSTV